MACFHIPSVTCENCAHLVKGSAKGPWVGVVTTGGTYFSSHDLTDAMQRLTLERDEARAERDKARAEVAEARIEAAAEMRERAAVAVEYALTSGLLTPFTARRVIGAVRALPLPGDEQ